MTTVKPWYLSRTIWASVVTVLIGAAGFAGLNTGAINGASLTDTLLQAATAISGLIAIVGRLCASKKIG